MFKIKFYIFLLGSTTYFHSTNCANVDIYKFNISRYGKQIQSTTCAINTFRCDSGQCISEIKLCDGNGDCDDNSDENIKVCNLEKCPNFAFTCNYGACIHINGRCNGLKDCFDGSDEESCTYQVTNNVTFLFNEGCRLPNDPLHGKYVVKNHLSSTHNPGNIVLPVFSELSVNCNKGFVVNPPENSTSSYCLPTKEWTPAPKTCVRLFRSGCRLPNDPPHGKYVVINHISAGYNPGDNVPVYGLLSVKCNIRYEVNPLSNDKPSYCLPTGEWNPAPKTCELISAINKGCRVPDNPPHGTYFVYNQLSTKSSLGDILPTRGTVENFGDYKYVIKDNLGDMVIVYGMEYNPRNNVVVPVNTLLSLKCNQGYEASSPPDNKQSTCLPTGDWNPAPPKTCELISVINIGCRVPDNPPHGTYFVYNQLSTESNFGDILPTRATVENFRDYDYVTEDNLGDMVPVYGVEYNPGNNVVVPVNTLLSLKCIEGYDASSSPDDKQSTCLPTGEWNPAPKTCAHSSLLSKTCQIPSNPPHGKYIVISDTSPEYSAGDFVPLKSVLSLNCTTGYAPDPSESENVSYCLISGEWSPVPKTCSRTCPSLISTRTTNVLCEFDGKPLNACSNAAENTLARLSCAPFYEEFNMKRYPTRLCKNGSWQYPIPQCYPICGRKRPLGVNIPNGMNSTPSDHSWQVGIYSQNQYICGGSIINQRIVLSAAHCFANKDGQIYPKNKFLIVAGKYIYSIFDYGKSDINAQYSDVNKILVPKRFQGKNNSYEADIAIILLSTPFQLSSNVQPVCIDLETENEQELNGYGTVKGWSIVKASDGDNKISFLAKDETVSFVSHNECIKAVSEKSRKFLTQDKICGKYVNRGTSSVEFSRSKFGAGDGLVFPKEANDQYLLKGIRVISSKYYGIYTSIAAHIGFIRESVQLVLRENLFKNHV